MCAEARGSGLKFGLQKLDVFIYLLQLLFINRRNRQQIGPPYSQFLKAMNLTFLMTLAFLLRGIC